LSVWLTKLKKNHSPTTLRPLLLAKPSLFPPLFPNSLARLPKRNGNSTLTRHFATNALRQGLKVHAKFAQQRLVPAHFIILFVCSNPNHGFTEGRRGSGEKEVVSYSLTVPSLLCPFMYALQNLGYAQITQYMTTCVRFQVVVMTAKLT